MSTERLTSVVRKVRRANRDLHTKHLHNKGDLHLLHIMARRFSEGTTPSVLAKHLGIAMPTISLKLSQLEELGMIERVQSKEDRRKTYVRVSGEGEAVLEESYRKYLSVWDNICKEFGAEKTEQLTNLLEELRDIMQKETEDDNI